MRKHGEKQPRLGVAPRGWLEELLETGDLEQAFCALRDHRGYNAEAWRGRIRWFQLRSREATRFLHSAWLHWENLESKDAVDFVFEVRNMSWRFENLLLSGNEWMVESWSVELPDGITMSARERQAVWETKCYVDALDLLFHGESAEAAAIFEDLFHTADDLRMRPIYALGLASAEYGRGMESEAERAMMHAEHTLRGIASPLYRARAAAALVAILRYLGDRARAVEWESYVHGLPCPKATKDVFLERAELIEERCSTLGRTIVL